MMSKRRIEINEGADGFYVSQYPSATHCGTVLDVLLDVARRLGDWQGAKAAAVTEPTPIESMLLEALKGIAKGEGCYSRDPLTFAANTIADMAALAKDAINKAEQMAAGKGD